MPTTLALRTVLTGSALGSPHAPPAPFHGYAAINDPLSHGQVGDNLLSLNAAIRLHNNTLAIAQLSVAEQARIALIPQVGVVEAGNHFEAVPRPQLHPDARSSGCSSAPIPPFAAQLRCCCLHDLARSVTHVTFDDLDEDPGAGPGRAQCVLG